MRGIVLAILTALSLQAATVVKEYRYMASDTDSKVSARKAALNTVQNMVMEELGTGVSTRFEQDQKITDARMQRELHLSVKNFASGFVQSKVLDESWDGKSYWLKAAVSMDEAGLYEKVMAHYQSLQAAAKSSDLERMLDDITTQEKRRAFITEAVKLPFAEAKDSVHYKIIRTFERHKIYDESYRAFLMQTLKGIDYPSWDARTEPILRYLSRSRPYNDGEIEVLLHILEYAKVHDSRFFLEMMFRPNVTVCDSGASKLLEGYFELLEEGKAGLPVYTNLAREISGIASAWSNLVNPECPLWGSDIWLDTVTSKGAKDVDPKHWADVLGDITQATAKNPTASNEELITLVRAIAPKLPESRGGKNAIENFFKKADPAVVAELAEDTAPDIRRVYASQRLYDQDIAFCIGLGVTIPQKVFSLHEYYEAIRSAEKESDRNAPINGISAYGKSNGGKNNFMFLEVLKFLDEANDHYHADKLVPILGEIGYDDLEATRLLLRFLSSDNANISRKARELLLKTDEPDKRIERIIEALPLLDEKRQKRAITLLSHFGDAAQKALPQLQPFKAKSKELKYSVEWLEKKLKS